MRGIILGAGSSKRMGQNKLAMKLGDKAILERAINNAKASRLDELVLVYGKYNMDTDIEKLYNTDYESGMSTSIKRGLEDFKGDAAMILLGDMPFVSSSIIDKLYEAFLSSHKNIVVPVCEGKRGNPVVIGRKYFDDLFNNTGDKGAREIIKNNSEDVELVEVGDKGIFVDVDDEESYKSIVKS
jgi:molybdenum cofactor cytidylyltransferase